MAREQKRAGDVEVGDSVYFPSSRRSRKVGQLLFEDGTVSLIAEDQSSKWMVGSDFMVSVEVEDVDD